VLYNLYIIESVVLFYREKFMFSTTPTCLTKKYSKFHINQLLKASQTSSSACLTSDYARFKTSTWQACWVGSGALEVAGNAKECTSGPERGIKGVI